MEEKMRIGERKKESFASIGMLWKGRRRKYKHHQEIIARKKKIPSRIFRGGEKRGSPIRIAKKRDPKT